MAKRKKPDRAARGLIAHYQCWQCRAEFSAAPGPVNCPRCDSNYSNWLNAEEILKVVRKLDGRRD